MEYYEKTVYDDINISTNSMSSETPIVYTPKEMRPKIKTIIRTSPEPTPFSLQ